VERALVNDATDELFRSRTGLNRPLGRGRADEAYRELWQREREALIHELHPTDRDRLERALRSPKMQRFMSFRPAWGPAVRPLEPGEVLTALRVAEEVEQLNEADLARFERVKAPFSGNWAETLAGVQRLRAAQAQDVALAARVAGTRDLYEKIRRVEALEAEALRNVTSPEMIMFGLLERDDARHEQAVRERDAALHAAGFADINAFNRAANDYRLVFRTRALEITREILGHIKGQLMAEQARYRDPREAATLLEIARSGRELTDDLEKRYPILKVDRAWEWAKRAANAKDLAARMGLRALERKLDIEQLEWHLQHDPDLVFRLDTMLALVKHELHPDEAQEAIIADQRGKPVKEESWLERALEIDLFILSLISGPAGWVIAGTTALFESASELSTYQVLSTAHEEQLTTQAPSKWAVARPLVLTVAVGGALHVGGVVVARGSRFLARAERALPEAEVPLGERPAIGEQPRIAAEPTTELMEPTAPHEVARETPTSPPPETAAVEPGAGGTAAGGPDAAVEVEGGHRVEATNRGIELCSAKPCPLLELEYAAELERSPQLAARLETIKSLRLRSKPAAARLAADLQRTLAAAHEHPDLFGRLPAHSTAEQAARLGHLLDTAASGGVRLEASDLEVIAARLEAPGEPRAMDRALDAVERNIRSRFRNDRDFARAFERTVKGDPALRRIDRHLASLSDAEMLAANLTKEVEERPPGHSAHHIVPKGMKEAAEAREILESAGIGINDARNGIWLPETNTVSNPDAVEIHTTMHEEGAIRIMTQELREAAAGGPDAVAAALAKIRRDIAEGRYKRPAGRPPAPTP
jgi:hypothetical protein